MNLKAQGVVIVWSWIASVWDWFEKLPPTIQGVIIALHLVTAIGAVLLYISEADPQNENYMMQVLGRFIVFFLFASLYYLANALTLVYHVPRELSQHRAWVQKSASTPRAVREHLREKMLDAVMMSLLAGWAHVVRDIAEHWKRHKTEQRSA